jgi:hypothetical protein
LHTFGDFIQADRLALILEKLIRSPSIDEHLLLEPESKEEFDTAHRNSWFRNTIPRQTVSLALIDEEEIVNTFCVSKAR